MDYLEEVWDNLLSQDPLKIRQAFSELDDESKQVVLKHLQLMSKEPGWQAQQVKSATIALQSIQNSPSQDA